MAAEKQVFLYGNADSRKEGEALVPGCIANGISEEAALTIWDKMESFAEYAFNKSHSAGYAVISVTTAWMKLYYGAEFEVANMNSLLGKAEDIQCHLNESRNLGIKVLGPDVNYSSAEFTLENGAIRVGLQGLKNLGKVGAKIAEKRTAPWANMESFMWDLIDVLDKRSVEALAYAGALDSFGIKRKTLVENSENIAEYLQKVRKFNDLSTLEDGTVLPEVPEVDNVYMSHIRPNLPKYGDEFEREEFFQHELEYCGMYVSGHPLDGMEEFYINKDIISLREIVPQASEDDEDDAMANISFYHGRTVNVLGICKEVKTIMTKKGDIMYNVSIEDAEGKMGITVFPKQATALSSADPFFFKKIKDKVIMANGKIQTDGYGTKMIAWSLTLVTPDLKEDVCPEIWVNTPDKDAVVRAEEILSDMRKVPEGTGSRVVIYYDLPKAQKAKVVGCYDVNFADFLRLKSDFHVITNCELSETSKEETGTFVSGDWRKLVLA